MAVDESFTPADPLAPVYPHTVAKLDKSTRATRPSPGAKEMVIILVGVIVLFTLILLLAKDRAGKQDPMPTSGPEQLGR